MIKWKKEISEANTGKPKTEEHKKKSGEANKIALKEYYKENPDILEKMSKRMKDVWENNPEKMKK